MKCYLMFTVEESDLKHPVVNVVMTALADRNYTHPVMFHLWLAYSFTLMLYLSFIDVADIFWCVCTYVHVQAY